MNIYERANKAYFDELKSLVFKYPKHYSIILSHKKKYLLEWINSQLPKLDDTFKVCNKCHWILKDAGADFEYQPGTAFRYEYGGKERAYFPDFRVGGRFVEIKGGQFLGESGEWICPWDRSLDGVYEAKRLCATENGVRILYPDDYAKYLEYADAKFGDGWAERFRTH